MSRLAVPVRAEPYRRAHEESVARGMRRGVPPRGLDSLLGWFRNRWQEELPVRVHVPGVWHDGVAASALGAPDDAPPWRLYLCGDPRTTDDDGNYLLPLRAALRHMWGNGSDESAHSMAARDLTILAFAGFDWRLQASREGRKPGQAIIHYCACVEMLWAQYAPVRIPRPSREALERRDAECA